MRTTNNKCLEFVQDKKTFQASNLHSEANPLVYAVYSYGWYPIYVFNELNQTWYGNSNRYSPSTARQMTHSRPDGDITWTDSETLRGFIRAANEKCFRKLTV